CGKRSWGGTWWCGGAIGIFKISGGKKVDAPNSHSCPCVPYAFDLWAEDKRLNVPCFAHGMRLGSLCNVRHKLRCHRYYRSQPVRGFAIACLTSPLQQSTWFMFSSCGLLVLNRKSMSTLQ
ncbi:unnamed protein product, partial [Pylaiella littoralis]